MPSSRLTTCSQPVSICTITGAAVGFLLALAHAAYPDQIVATLATLGAVAGYAQSRDTTRPMGDVVLLEALLLLTTTLAGWNLANLPGGIAGASVAIPITFVMIRSVTKRQPSATTTRRSQCPLRRLVPEPQ
jgi:hypothetical protein